MKFNTGKTLRMSFCMLVSILLMTSMFVPVTILKYNLEQAYKEYDVKYQYADDYRPPATWMKEFTYNLIALWFTIISLICVLFLWKTIYLPEKLIDFKKIKEELKK